VTNGLFELRRAFPVLLEKLLPVLSPWPTQKIDIAFVERSELRRSPVRSQRDAVFDAALDEKIAKLRIVDAAGAIPGCDDPQRALKCLRVVRNSFDDETLAVSAPRKRGKSRVLAIPVFA